MRKVTNPITLSLFAMVLLGTESYAEELKSPWYVGVGVTTAIVSDTNCEDITYGVMAKVGYSLHENLALEARAIQTNWEYEGAKVKQFGLSIKPQYQMNEELSFYGLLGYGQTTVSSKYNLDETGLSYGLGLDYNLGDKIANKYSIFVDYERLLQKSSIPDIDAFSLGLAYKF